MKTEWSKFKKLDEVSHILLRPGRYIGSINPVTQAMWYFNEAGKIEHKEMTFVPAFHKLFDEIISNSADHSRTKEGAHLNEINVTVDAFNGIHVRDNGGIPVVKHPEYDQWIPEMIFGELRSGSNFDDADDSLSTGQNGEGASLTNIFSTEFVIWTRNDGMEYKQHFKNNMTEKFEPEIKKSKGAGFTSINYVPDLPRFGMTDITWFDVLLMKRRSFEIAFTNPHLKVSFNGEECSLENFDQFIKAFNPQATIQNSDRWIVGVGFSTNGFQHTSYVNSTPSNDGGTHVDYVSEKIVEAIRQKVEEKTKQKLRPSDIKNNIHLFLDCQINNPRYNSQTKDKLITAASDYGSRFELTDAFVKQILNSQMMKDILAWAERRKELDAAKEIEEEAKQIKRQGFHDIPKYRPATNKDRSDCILFITEGDSALKPILAASNPKVHGVFPLKGKPENCFAKSARETLSKEILYIMTILNLSLIDPDYDNLRYKKIVIATDADKDGIHIRGLLILLFKKFWPALLERGIIQFLETPSRIAIWKGKEYDFRDDEPYYEFIEGKTNIKTKYCKGLGSHNSDKFRTFLSDPDCFVTVDYNSTRDDDWLNMAFDPARADDRKNWVAII